ncbi:MAG: hypothetical protein IJC10_04855 [Clostridia bacterium]|nr:hypothetical protein [Clostridia bacterium]
MKGLDIVSIVLILVGAIINFLVPPVIKKKSGDNEETLKTIYIVKSLGLILVIIGCIIFFWLGGKFGV